jgi:hypothetical protein
MGHLDTAREIVFAEGVMRRFPQIWNSKGAAGCQSAPEDWDDRRMILRISGASVYFAVPLLATAPSWAEDRAEFVEPIIIEETLPNQVGEWDLRISCACARGRTDVPANCLRAQVFFGIAPRWAVEFEAALPNISGNRPAEARAEVGGALKYLLRTTGRGPALVLALETGFAVGQPDVSEDGRLELQPTFAFLQSLGRTTVQGNVGYAVTPGGAKKQQRAVHNLSVAVPWRQARWHTFAELAGSAGDGFPELVFSPGLKYGFGGGHFFAFGLPIGLNSASPKVGAVFQVQFALSKAREGVEQR